MHVLAIVCVCVLSLMIVLRIVLRKVKVRERTFIHLQHLPTILINQFVRPLAVVLPHTAGCVFVNNAFLGPITARPQVKWLVSFAECELARLNICFGLSSLEEGGTTDD